MAMTAPHLGVLVQEVGAAGMALVWGKAFQVASQCANVILDGLENLAEQAAQTYAMEEALAV